ncbi:RNA polymerase II mediator complex subunit [Elasticomyces elasticus]|nr:RNA polymerase II mediator complex subunit [Elasticomyces elasticus]
MEGFCGEDRGDAIFEALHPSAQSNTPIHTHARELCKALQPELRNQQRKLSNAQFFDALPRYLQTNAVANGTRTRDEIRGECLRAVEAVVVTSGVPNTTASLACAIEKLTIYNKILASKVDNASTIPQMPAVSSPVPMTPISASTSTPWDDKRQEVLINSFSYLHMLLRVINAQAEAHFSDKTVQNELVKVLVLILNIITQPTVTSLLDINTTEQQKTEIRKCMSFAEDVAARLSDHLTDESRVLCARVLKDKMLDKRVTWIIGSVELESKLPGVNTTGPNMISESKGDLGPFKPKSWDMLESGGGKEGEVCFGLGMFNAKRV